MLYARRKRHPVRSESSNLAEQQLFHEDTPEHLRLNFVLMQLRNAHYKLLEVLLKTTEHKRLKRNTNQNK